MHDRFLRVDAAAGVLSHMLAIGDQPGPALVAVAGVSALHVRTYSVETVRINERLRFRQPTVTSDVGVFDVLMIRVTGTS